MTDEDAVKLAIHDMNKQAHGLNRDIVQKSATMNDIPIQKDIYKQPARHSVPQQQQPVQQQPVHQQQVALSQPVAPQPQITGDPALLNSLIERVSAVEKQFTKLITLIERRVAKNAKEINIRIKLNENNDSTNKE